MLECEKCESYAVHNVWVFLFHYLPLLPRCQILHSESTFLHAIDYSKSRVDCLKNGSYSHFLRAQLNVDGL